MNELSADRVVHEIPVFSECVIGFRAWGADGNQQLWPMTRHRRPWVPGINTARCECRTSSSLRFEWTWQDGRRVLEPAAAHEAPDEECSCGLYSLRRPRREWFVRPELSVPPRVIGAVASWGRMQVHDSGFRAEHACVIAIARHHAAAREAVQELARIASRYRVELVFVDELKDAAARYGSPLPELLGATVSAPKPAATTAGVIIRAPDLAPDDVSRSAVPGRTRAWGLIDPLTRPHRTASFRVRAAFLALECCVALAFLTLAVLSYRSTATSSYVQRHGIRTAGYIEAVHHQTCGTPYEPASCIQTSLTVRLTRSVHGVRRLQIDYGRYVAAPANRRVIVRVDPQDPHYGELANQPRTSAVIWIVAAILAAAVITVAVLDGAALLRKRRRHRERARGLA